LLSHLFAEQVVNYVRKDSNRDLPAPEGGREGGRERESSTVFDNVPRSFYNSPTLQIIMLQRDAYSRGFVKPETTSETSFIIHDDRRSRFGGFETPLRYSSKFNGVALNH